MDCLCIGILVADHLCSPIARLPAAGELVMADSLPLSVGGCAANVAIDLARLGVRASVVGRVGQDAFGQFVIDTIERQGAQVEHIQKTPSAATSGTLIINVQGEDRRFIHSFGANADFRASDVPDSALRAAKVVYLGGYLLMPALDPDETAALFRRAKSLGSRTILDVVVPAPGDYRDRMLPVLKETDVFLPNTDEALQLTGETDALRQAEWIRAAGTRTAIVTLGGEGCVVVGEGIRGRAESYQTPYVGGTGAGDAFVAGYIAALLHGLGEHDCLAWASATGASCVRDVSATASVFQRMELLSFLAAHPFHWTDL